MDKTEGTQADRAIDNNEYLQELVDKQKEELTTLKQKVELLDAQKEELETRMEGLQKEAEKAPSPPRVSDITAPA